MLRWAPLHINHCLHLQIFPQDNFQGEEFLGQGIEYFPGSQNTWSNCPPERLSQSALASDWLARGPTSLHIVAKSNRLSFSLLTPETEVMLYFYLDFITSRGTYWKYFLANCISSVNCLFLSFLHLSYHFGMLYLYIKDISLALCSKCFSQFLYCFLLL